MPCDMTLYVHGDRHASDVRGGRFDMNGKGGGPSAEALGPYTQVVDFFQQFSFQISDDGIRIMFA
jgi:hypothetical protein